MSLFAHFELLNKMNSVVLEEKSKKNKPSKMDKLYFLYYSGCFPYGPLEMED